MLTNSFFPNKLPKIINEFYHKYLKIIAPIFCLNCLKAGNEYLCSDCYKKLNLDPKIYCFSCRKRLPDDKSICSRTHQQKIKFFISLGNYETKILREIIIFSKYEGYFRLLNSFFNFENLWLKEKYHLVPVPLTKKKLLNRGFNQTEIIAEKLKEKFGFEIVNCLEKIKETKDQASLSLDLRKENLKGAFKLKFNPGKINILLVDDVITSGYTLLECAKILKQAGIKTIGAFVLLS